mmetsp:Transcript_21066/g.39149  ORF Transcript_21066/g.39149 Transcript_21066/m.39149 type:complete len:116 (-) Transcript_21066:95-442(-)
MTHSLQNHEDAGSTWTKDRRPWHSMTGHITLHLALFYHVTYRGHAWRVVERLSIERREHPGSIDTPKQSSRVTKKQRQRIKKQTTLFLEAGDDNSRFGPPSVLKSLSRPALPDAF